jgi:hypothetical protein
MKKDIVFLAQNTAQLVHFSHYYFRIQNKNKNVILPPALLSGHQLWLAGQ